MKSWFGRAVSDILDNQQWFVEESLFRFDLLHTVLVGALPRIAQVPLEAADLIGSPSSASKSHNPPSVAICDFSFPRYPAPAILLNPSYAATLYASAKVG